jgi:biofilm PGA synthesis N-glycosyltransferase PgaC
MSSFVTLGSLAALGYTYVGYPLVIGALAKLSPIETTPDPSYTPMVSALIPAFNCESYLDKKLDSLLALDYPKDKLEILVLSDGSTDGTDELLRRRAAEDPRVRPLRNDRRSGKPTALNLMKKEARGEVLLLTDARQPLERGALRALVRHLADPTVGCVSGNLVLEGDAGSGVYWRYENWIRQQEASFRSMVGVTGPIYALRKEDLAEVPADLILDDVWTPMRLRLSGKKVLFEKGAIAHDDAFGDEREFGRKARTLAGNYQVFALMPELLVPLLNPSWFETFSHKLLRLAGPWMLGALAASTLKDALAPAKGLRAPYVWVARGLLAGQVVFYLAAAAGPAAGKLPGVARTFVMMNGAAVVGLYRHLRGAQRVTW